MARIGYEFILDEFDTRLRAAGLPVRYVWSIRDIKRSEKLRIVLLNAHAALYRELRQRAIDRMDEVYTSDVEALVGGAEFITNLRASIETAENEDAEIDFHPARSIYDGPRPSNWDAILAGTEHVFKFDTRVVR